MEKLFSFLVNFCTVNSLWFASYSNKCTTWKVKYSHNDEYWSKVHKSMHPIWTLNIGTTIVYQPCVLLIVFLLQYINMDWAELRQRKIRCSALVILEISFQIHFWSLELFDQKDTWLNIGRNMCPFDHILHKLVKFCQISLWFHIWYVST